MLYLIYFVIYIIILFKFINSYRINYSLINKYKLTSQIILYSSTNLIPYVIPDEFITSKFLSNINTKNSNKFIKGLSLLLNKLLISLYNIIMESRSKLKNVASHKSLDKYQQLTTINKEYDDQSIPILEHEQVSPLNFVNIDWKLVKEKNITPILAFVNRKSGGLRGNQAIGNLQNCINTIQICDLSSYKPSEYIKFFNQTEFINNVTMLCCGGDGTIGWIMNEVRHVYQSSSDLSNKPNISYAIIPFGTGNDLFLHLLSTITLTSVQKQNILTSISADSLIANPTKVLEKYSNLNNQVVQLDRWNINITPNNSKFKKYYIANNVLVRKSFSSDHSLSTSSSRTFKRKRLISFIKRITIPKNLRISTRKFKNNQIKKLKKLKNNLLNNKGSNKTFNNYFGIGIDGQVALSFTSLRSKFPYVFFHPFINKVWYFLVGVYIFLFYSRKKLCDHIEILCDNEYCNIPSSCTGIIITNISSYAGGSKLWTFGNDNSDKWITQSTNDEIIEVVGVTGVYHLGIIKIGLSKSFPIAQGRNIRISTRSRLPMQVDGEPWTQRACNIDINLLDKVKILVPTVDNE